MDLFWRRDRVGRHSCREGMSSQEDSDTLTQKIDQSRLLGLEEELGERRESSRHELLFLLFLCLLSRLPRVLLKK